MDLVAGRQVRRRQPSKQAGQTRIHAGTDDHRHPRRTCDVVEVEHRSDVGEVIADRHDAHAAIDELTGQVRVRASMGEYGDRDVSGEIPPAPRIVVDEGEALDHRWQTTGDPLADDTAADDRNDRHHVSGSSSGRHPPCCGGVPPEPRTLRIAAARPITMMAENARRRNFIRPAG